MRARKGGSRWRWGGTEKRRRRKGEAKSMKLCNLVKWEREKIGRGERQRREGGREEREVEGESNPWIETAELCST